MRIVYEYSHLGGSEILQVRYPEINAEIHNIIKGVVASKTKVCQERGRVGELVYNPTELNKDFKESFENQGYNELRDNFKIPVCSRTGEPDEVTSYKQIDFHKDRVLIEVQFGKYFAMFYDMAKFQYFFNENKTDVGVEIVPCNYMKKEMSSGVSFGEHLMYDIKRLKRHFPAVPIKLILIGPDEDELD
ncbi:Restriction endonuclease BglII [anaerobic digester metagenome]